MAQRINGPVDYTSRRSYDFEKYADGADWALTRGEDFDTKGATVVAAARRWAKDQGYEVDSKVVGATDDAPERVVLRFRQNEFQAAPEVA